MHICTQNLVACHPCPELLQGTAPAASFVSSVSSNNTTREVLVEEEFAQHHMKPFLGSPPEMGNEDGGLRHITGPSEPPPAPPAVKKKRSLPGTPDPSAEVIALSPRTLMATNRFVCEICHKGFQRDQNLQLHRRGHNLPWKLRQRGGGAGEHGGGGGGGGPPRKRVYVCPEASCVHHHPARALGDLTGIKKHFCRKHGEKKWKCERCAKRYAVHSDWKAHAKVCGTREYKCDCGTLFSRRDSFVTHRAFCDALAQENNKLAQPMNMATVASALQGQATAPHHLALPAAAAADDDLVLDTKSPHLRMLPDDTAATTPPPLSMAGCMLSSLASRPSPAFFAGGSRMGPVGLNGPSDPGCAGLLSPVGSASLSATALLQKAAEMGATTSSGYGAGFSTVGFGPMFGGPDRLLPAMSLFGPTRPSLHGPLDGLLPLGHSQLVGLDVSELLLPCQQQAAGSMTRAIGSPTHVGAQHQQVRPDGGIRIVDYMGVDGQRSFSDIGPFGPHMGPWA